MSNIRVLSGVVWWMFMWGLCRAEAPRFLDLGGLSPPFHFGSAFAISADGRVVIGSGLDAAGMRVPLRWSVKSGVENLGAVGPGDGFANGVSGDGSVVVGGIPEFGGLTAAFRWTASAGMQLLPHPPGERPVTRALSVSNDGRVIVGESSTRDLGAGSVLWRDGQVAPFPFDENAAVFAVSPGGEVFVGGIDTQDADMQGVAFRWSEVGGMQILGALDIPIEDKPSAFASAVSGDTNVVVGTAGTANGTVAFRWTDASGMMSLGDLPGGRENANATSVSGNGGVVVGVGETEFSVAEAFIWTADGGMRGVKDSLESLGLDLTGWALIRAWDVSDDGRTIVGEGINPSGQGAAWLAVIPEPDSFFLAAIGLAFLATLVLIRAAFSKRRVRVQWRSVGE